MPPSVPSSASGGCLMLFDFDFDFLWPIKLWYCSRRMSTRFWGQETKMCSNIHARHIASQDCCFENVVEKPHFTKQKYRFIFKSDFLFRIYPFSCNKKWTLSFQFTNQQYSWNEKRIIYYRIEFRMETSDIERHIIRIICIKDIQFREKSCARIIVVFCCS